MKRQRRKYSRPRHPWEKDRMDAEDGLMRKYGLSRKEEVWRAESLLRSFRRQAKRLLAAAGPQAEREVGQLLGRLRKLGLIGEGEGLDSVLGLDLESLLGRRLQTLVFLKGLARSPRHARQLISHGHITIMGKRVSVPSYLVPVDEEGEISSTLGSSSAAHQEREGPEPTQT